VPDQDTELLYVFEISRHGARAPFKDLEFKENISTEKMNYDLSQLTTMGMR